MLSPIITAFRALTILPVADEDTHRIGRSIAFFPLVGVFIGAAVLFGQAAITATSIAGWILPAILLVAGETLLTGALHIDGLADIADAFGSGGSREKILRSLRNSRLGTQGLLAGLFDLLIKVAAWAWLFDAGRPLVVFWSIVFGRCAQSISLAFLPNALYRPAAIASVGRGAKAGALFSVAISVALASWVCGPVAGFAYSGIALLAASGWGWHCLYRIGGITGDCLGAANELAEISILLIAWAAAA